MTAYTAIPDSDIDPESPGTSALFTLIRDNPIAIMEKASGAPVLANDYIVQTMIGAAAVGQAELSRVLSTTSTTSTSPTTYNSYNQHQFEKTLRSSNVYFANYVHDDTVNDTAATGVFKFTLASSQAGWTAYCYIEYVQASPPYDLGDGECGLFVYLGVDNNGDVVNTYLAPDPTWASGGKIRTRPDKTINGRKYMIKKPLELFVEGGGDVKQLFNSKRDEALAMIANKTETLIEVTSDIKNANMNELPHPFAAHPPEVVRTIMLDPVSEENHQLLEMHSQGVDVSDLLHKKYLVIDNTPSGRQGPAGLMIPAFRWKNGN